jgi:hypothetical protein
MSMTTFAPNFDNSALVIEFYHPLLDGNFHGELSADIHKLIGMKIDLLTLNPTPIIMTPRDVHSFERNGEGFPMYAIFDSNGFWYNTDGERRHFNTFDELTSFIIDTEPNVDVFSYNDRLFPWDWDDSE